MKKLILLSLSLVIITIKIFGMEPEQDYPYRDIAKYGDITSHLGSLPPELRKELAQYVTEAERKMQEEFTQAIATFNVEKINNLLQEGANPNDILGLLDDRYTPLTYILRISRSFFSLGKDVIITIFHLLVNAGADPRKLDGDNCTPLLLAINNSYPEIASLILEEFKDYPRDTLNINQAIRRTQLSLSSEDWRTVTALDLALEKYGPTSSLTRRLLSLGAKTYEQIVEEREKEDESAAINRKMEKARQEFEEPLLFEVFEEPS